MSSASSNLPAINSEPTVGLPIPGNTAQSLPKYWGRAWSLRIASAANPDSPTISITNIGEQNTLKVSFSVEKKYWQDLWWADISIYNLREDTEQFAIQQGDIVTLSAGYKSDFSTDKNLIFKGEVFQPFWERREVVDYVVTLRCTVGLPYYVANFVKMAQGPQASQADIVARMARESHNKIPIDQIDTSRLSTKRLPRSKVFFGSPKDYFEQMARDAGFISYFGPKGLNLRPRQFDANTQPDIVYAPQYVSKIPNAESTSGIVKRTIVRTPQQTQEGIIFEVLMDSDVTIGTIVKLDMSVIRQIPLEIGKTPARLDQDGMYIVCAVRYIGDTRGNEWTTEITGLTWSFWNNWLNRKQPAISQADVISLL